MLGIDVSNWQRAVMWHEVAASGRKFAFAKATQGTSFVDPFFIDNWQGMRSAGLLRGAYHYSLPSGNASPQQEVEHFADTLEVAGGLQPTDLIALDLEDPAADTAMLADWQQEWLTVAESVFGFKPGLYSGWWYMNPRKLFTPWLRDNGNWLWLAAYTDAPLALPDGFLLSIWQFSSRSSVPGVSGNCDEDQFFGDLAALSKLGKQGEEDTLTPEEKDELATLFGINWGNANDAGRYEELLKDPAVAERAKALGLVDPAEVKRQLHFTIAKAKGILGLP